MFTYSKNSFWLDVTASSFWNKSMIQRTNPRTVIGLSGYQEVAWYLYKHNTLEFKALTHFGTSSWEGNYRGESLNFKLKSTCSFLHRSSVSFDNYNSQLIVNKKWGSMARKKLTSEKRNESIQKVSQRCVIEKSGDGVLRYFPEV